MLADARPVTAVRLDVYPDGGMARLRLHGRPTERGRAALYAKDPVMTVRYTVNCSILFTELPLLERPAAASDAGFDAVEFWWPFASAVPADAEVDAFAGAIEDAGVQLTGLNFAAGDMPAATADWCRGPAAETEFRDNIDVAVGIGERLGTRAFNALYGNRVDGVDPATRTTSPSENLAAAAAARPHRRHRAGRTGQRRARATR